MRQLGYLSLIVATAIGALETVAGEHDRIQPVMLCLLIAGAALVVGAKDG